MASLLIHWPLRTDRRGNRSCCDNSRMPRLSRPQRELGRGELIADDADRRLRISTPSRIGKACIPDRNGSRFRSWRRFRRTSTRAWRQRNDERSSRSSFHLPEGKKKPTAKQLLKESRRKPIAPYPPDLLSCLTKDTAWWKHTAGRNHRDLSGSSIGGEAIRSRLGYRSTRDRSIVKPVTTMLLALTTPSGNRSALPPCTRTLPQAELFHRAIVGRVGKGDRVHCPELTGRDEARQAAPRQPRSRSYFARGSRRRRAHRSPHHLRENGTRRRRAAAIRTLRRTWTKGGVGEIQLAVVGYGDLEDSSQLPPPL